jgi:hypothetical protein
VGVFGPDWAKTIGAKEPDETRHAKTMDRKKIPSSQSPMGLSIVDYFLGII